MWNITCNIMFALNIVKTRKINNKILVPQRNVITLQLQPFEKKNYDSVSISITAYRILNHSDGTAHMHLIFYRFVGNLRPSISP